MLQYKYSYTLRGHEKDVRRLPLSFLVFAVVVIIHCISQVRSVASTHTGSLVSASRDHSVRLWPSSEDKITESGCASLFGHEKFVNSCCAIPPCTRFPAGAVASGSQDRSVIIWDNNEPAFILQGHTEQVRQAHLRSADMHISADAP
jgi:WD40 repeat protein